MRRPRILAPRLAAAVLAALACSCGGAEPRANLVVVTIDTLRADHLGCYGYVRDTSPNLDALADDAVLFEQVFAPLATTLPSHTSLFTGLAPLEHGVLANFHQGGGTLTGRLELTLFAEMAAARGFDTAGFVSATPLKPPSGIDRGFQTFTFPGREERRAGATVRDALDWLDEGGDAPFFLWVHLFDPHWRYDPPAGHDLYDVAVDLEDWIAERRFPDVVRDRDTRESHDGYDGEIHFADGQVRELVDGLRERGLLDTSVLVVTSDHGEALGQHGWHAHERVEVEQLHVPLIVRPPGGRGELPERVATIGSTMQVLPTVLPWVDDELARTFAAQSTRASLLESDPGAALVAMRATHRSPGDESGPEFALTTRDWHYIHRPEEGDSLYDRAADPFGLVDLAGARAGEVADLRGAMFARIDAWNQRAARFGEPSIPIEIDPAIVREMEALGY